LADLAPALELMRLAKFVAVHKTIAIGEGPPGIGKSMAMGAACVELAGLGVRIDSDSRSAGGFKLALWNAMHGRRLARARVSLAEVAHGLRAGPWRFIAIDQSHELSDRALLLLRDVFDLSGLGILLVGTTAIGRRLSDDLDSAFSQLSSRVGLRVSLLPDDALIPRGGGQPRQWVTVEQLRRAFNMGRLKLHPDATRLLLQIANFSVGYLRRAKAVYVLAVAFAERDRRAGGALTAEHVQAALRRVTGDKPLPLAGMVTVEGVAV
jgi:hypothetical protein